ncbi:MAG: UDP-N-acetylglucosamine 2-epimerase (non-hydrolyzing) [Phycisphaerae bacterium]|nr:UDP-N-acetylglucosamine 2-epimerase (non-hydrolyzing) [Phycisphaerae bacterium]
MSRKTTILITAGTRPEAIKVAPLIRTLQERDFARVRVLATAQHRDLLDQVFRFFNIRPDVDLNIMQPGQTLAELTSRLIPAIDQALAIEQPDIVLAQGDTTTVMTTALACFYRRIPFGHVEAGLRTNDRHYPFPEEINRVIVSRLGDLHFSPTEQTRENLLHEGVSPESIFVTGNTVIDALLWAAAKADLPQTFQPSGGRRMLLVTAHRRENFGEPLREICHAIADLVKLRAVEVVYPVHPNPNVVQMTNEMLGGLPGVQLVPPLDYPQFVAAMKAAHLILTDSGGVQEEAPSLGKPVLVLRDETERPEGVAVGTAALVGPHRERIVSKAIELLDNSASYELMARAHNPFGDGRASERIADALEKFLAGNRA